jgi:hypothetical protein
MYHRHKLLDLKLNQCCRRRSLWVRAALVATQLYGKLISSAVNQHATTEEAMFSVSPLRGYITRISRG